MADASSVKRRKHFPFPESTVKKMKDGLGRLFSFTYAIVPLEITKSNGDFAVPFARASCTSKSCPQKFYFAAFFQSTIKKAAEIIMGNASDMSEQDNGLFQSLFTVLEKSHDIAQRLQKMNDKEKETAYAIQLAHHLLGPLSLYQEYIMDHTMENHSRKCVCCKKNIAGEFGDTSMGNERVWHGSTHILIGKKPDRIVPVVVRISEEETDDEDETGDYPDSMEQCRHQLIAEAIVFGLLRFKMNPSDNNSLTPTIAISERDVKIYFYDARHDYLLESPSLPLFSGEDLHVGTLAALWLTVNYHVTCTGLTEAVVDTGFTSDFMQSFSDEVKDLYKKELKFGNCKKTPNLYDSNKQIMFDMTCDDGFSKPFERSFDYLTEQHYNIIHAVSEEDINDSNMDGIKGLVEEKINNNQVMMFSKTYCPYCTKAKKALSSVGATFELMELDNLPNGAEIQAYLVSKSGSRTVPQVFINGKHIGGGTETENFAKNGKLKEMLGLA